MAEKKTRKLAAILFADIQGYSALMEKDENIASGLLSKFRSVLTEKVAEHGGRIVNFYGDGCLAVFESPLKSVQCAVSSQQTFLTEPKVPVRIGLHSGVVVFEDDNVYGDSVNQASRVESIGLAGSVLMSEHIRRQIKNHPDYQTQLLGTYEFKNIEEPMKVFALTNEGFTVPQAGEIKGKLKTKANNGMYKWLVPALIIVLAIAGLGTWQSASSGVFGSLSANDSPLSEDIRNKRIAVMLFENQTMNADLEVFGKMISDWVTKGLMETGEANVISAANIQPHVNQASILGGNGDFFETTGVGVIIQGRYYLQEEQLIIHANVVDAEKGEVIHALDPIQGPRSQMMNLLSDLTNRLLGYWSVREQSRFLQNPPNYQAYKKYMEADALFGQLEYVQQTQDLLLEAYRLDTTFYAPLLKLTVHYSNQARRPKERDSLLNYIDQKNPPFTKWEKLRYESIKAGNAVEGNWLKSAKLNEEMFQMDQSDATANYNAIMQYARANYPRKAIELSQQLNQQFRDMNSDFSWREPRVASAYFMIEDYAPVVKIAKKYPFPKMLDIVASLHLKALVRLDSLETLNSTLNDYLSTEIHDFLGTKIKHDGLIQAICEEAYLLDLPLLLEEYVIVLESYAGDKLNGDHYHENMGFVEFYRGNFEGALEHWSRESEPTKFPWLMPRRYSRIGTMHALVGDTASANLEILKIKQINAPILFRADIIYLESRILNAAGKKDEAIEVLKNAIEQGATFSFGKFWRQDIFLKSLFDDPKFQELVKPKG